MYIGTWRNPPNVLNYNSPVLLENKISLTIVCASSFRPSQCVILPVSEVRDAVPLNAQKKAAEGAEPGDAGPGGQVGEGPLLHHAEV